MSDFLKYLGPPTNDIGNAISLAVIDLFVFGHHMLALTIPIDICVRYQSKGWTMWGRLRPWTYLSKPEDWCMTAFWGIRE